MIETHLSLLLVAIPLLAAPIAAILPNGRLPWLLTLVVTWITLVLAAWQLSIVIDGDIISYELGGWAPPWGIEYRIDPLNALVALIVAARYVLVPHGKVRIVVNDDSHKTLTVNPGGKLLQTCVNRLVAWR